MIGWALCFPELLFFEGQLAGGPNLMVTVTNLKTSVSCIHLHSLPQIDLVAPLPSVPWTRQSRQRQKGSMWPVTGEVLHRHPNFDGSL